MGVKVGFLNLNQLNSVDLQQFMALKALMNLDEFSEDDVSLLQELGFLDGIKEGFENVGKKIKGVFVKEDKKEGSTAGTRVNNLDLGNGSDTDISGKHSFGNINAGSGADLELKLLLI